MDHDSWLLREADKNCNDSCCSKNEQIKIVDGIINDFDTDAARDCLEAWIYDVAKLMTEDECKNLLKRFLHSGKSEEFINLEIENYFDSREKAC